MADTAAPLTAEEAVAQVLMRAGLCRVWAVALQVAEDIVPTVRWPDLRWDLDDDRLTPEHRSLLATLAAERASRAGDDGLRTAAKAVVDDLARVFQRDDDADPVNIYRMWVELHDHADALRAALDRAPAPAIDRERLARALRRVLGTTDGDDRRYDCGDYGPLLRVSEFAALIEEADRG